MPLPTAEIRIDRSLFRALRSFDANRLDWLDKAAAAAPLAQLRFGPVRTWSVTDPDLARQMLIADAASWERPPAAIIPIRMGVGENLFTLPDNAWENLQPQVAPAFRKRALDTQLNSMQSIIDDAVDTIPRNQPFDVELTMGALALRLAAWVLFGDRLSADRALALATHQQQIVTWVGQRMVQLRSVVPFAVGSAARAMRIHQTELNNYADELLDRLKTNTVTDDVDDVGRRVAQAMVDGKPMPKEDQRTQVRGLLLAGNETTAAALSWAIVNAARNPYEWARLRSDTGAVRPFLDASKPYSRDPKFSRDVRRCAGMYDVVPGFPPENSGTTAEFPAQSRVQAVRPRISSNMRTNFGSSASIAKWTFAGLSGRDRKSHTERPAANSAFTSTSTGMNSIVKIVGSMIAHTANASWIGATPDRCKIGCVAWYPAMRCNTKREAASPAGVPKAASSRAFSVDNKARCVASSGTIRIGRPQLMTTRAASGSRTKLNSAECVKFPM